MTAHAIPRCYHDPCKEKLTLQLHGFCDSSQVALAAVVYLRTVYVDTLVSTSMVIAKSRVCEDSNHSQVGIVFSSAS